MDMRRILSLLLAIAMVVSMCPVQAFATGEDGSAVVSDETETPAEPTTDSTGEGTYPALEMGVKTLAELPEGGTTYFTFTPDVTCTYLFTSHTNADTYGCIYDTDMNELASNDDYNGLNFGVAMELTAGETYILGARYLSNEAGSFDVSVVHSDHSEVVTREPSCDAEGAKEYTCNLCGTAWTEVLPVAHNYNEEYFAPTCTEDGSRVYTCSGCGDTYTEVIPAGHDYYDGICQNCGETQVSEGVVNETINWHFDWSTKTLTLSGTGATPDYTGSQDLPWWDCSSWTKHVVVEEGITRIGDFVLSYLHDAETVSLPSTLVEVGRNAFYNCGMDTVVLPESLTTIGEHAFECVDLTEVVIPNGVTSLGYGAFGWCDDLQSVTLPDSLTEIGEYAFQECHSLTSIVFGEALAKINANAFQGCTALTQVELPASLRAIEQCAFNQCTALRSIVLPEGLEFLGDCALRDTALETVILPASLTELFGHPFDGCDNLSAIYVAEGSETFCSVDGAVYSADGTMLFLIPTVLKTFTVPETVTSLNWNAFQGNEHLHSIIFTGDCCGDFYVGYRNVTCYYPSDNETWTEAVTNGYGENTTWKPISDLMILVGPESVEAVTGQTVTLSVLVQGTDVSYQWQVSTDAGESWTDVDGANDAELTLTAENEDDGNCYRCVITDAAANEAISESAELAVIPIIYVEELFTAYGTELPSGGYCLISFTPETDGTYYLAVNCADDNIYFGSEDGLECYEEQYRCYRAELTGGRTYTFRVTPQTEREEPWTVGVTVQDRLSLAMGENSIELMHGETREYAFTPAESGTYVFYNGATDRMDVSAWVYGGDSIAVSGYCYSDSYPGYVMDLEAGVTYVLSIRNPNEYGCWFNCCVAPATPAENLWFQMAENLTGMVGTSTNVNVSTNTPTAGRPNLSWTTDNPDVATAEAIDGLLGRVDYIGVGTCTITVTDADSGATASFGVNVTEPTVLYLGDNTVCVGANSTEYFSFTAEESGTYVFHFPWEDMRYDFYRLDAAGNQYRMYDVDANGRYGVYFDAAAGETVYFAFRNNTWDSPMKTMTVDMGIPAERIGLDVDCLAGTVNGGMGHNLYEEDILQIGAKYTAVSDDPSVAVAGIDSLGDLSLNFVGLGQCQVTISTVNAAGETVSKTITVKSKEDQDMVYGEHTLTMMYGETEYYLFTPEESGYYVIWFPDLTEQNWYISAGQYDIWANEYYRAAGCVGYRFWLDAGVRAMIHVDNRSGGTDTQRFVFAKGTEPTGIQVSQSEITTDVGQDMNINAWFLPATAVGGWLSWESSDAGVVYVEPYDSGSTAWLRFNNPGTATVRVYSDELGVEAVINVTVNPENPLTLGENTLWISSEGETFAYFTPEVSGDYVLSYSQGHSHIQSVYGADGSCPAQYSDMVEGTYVLTATLEAGKLYRYSAFAYMDGELTFTLNPADETTGITLDRESLSAVVGARTEVHAHLVPLTSGVNTLTWESGNTDIFTVEVQNGTMYAFINPVGVGETTLTVRTEEGCEVTIPVTITMPPALELGENTVTGDPFVMDTYSFTAPADGTYIIHSPKSQGWPDMWPADYEAVNWYASSEYSYWTYSMTMTAGQTCILYITNGREETHTWTITVEEARNAEALSIVAPYGDTGYVGTSLRLCADVHPGSAMLDELTWSISNDYVGMVVPVSDYEASVYLVAGGFADITVTTASGLSATYRIYSEVPENLSVGDSREVTLAPGNQIVYTFTPDEDGWYVLYYGEDENIFDLTVTDGNGDQPSYSFHSSGNRMAHRMQLTGGETYHLSLYHDSVYTETVTRNITLAKATAAESVTLIPDQGVYTTGRYGRVSVEQNPITAVDPVVRWESSNSEVVEILSWWSDAVDFNCRSSGSVILTVYYESGLTASVEITVSDYESLEEGDNSLFINVGEGKTYLFTPSQTGLYGLTTWYNPWQTTVTTADGEAVACTYYVRYYQYETRKGYLFQLEEGVTYQITVYNGYYGDTESNWQWFALLPEVPAESIELNNYDIYMEQGGISYLAAYVYPSNAYSAEVTWVVGDESIVTIDEYGDVRAVGVGTTTITAVSGDASAVCNVTVSAAETVAEGTYDVYLESWGGSKSYRFVSEEDGTYVFALDGNNWGMMMLHVYENGVDVTGDLDYYRTSRNVGRSLTLTAGAEYILNFNNMNEWPYGGCVYIYRSEGISQVRFEQDTVSGYVGKSSEILPWIDPQFAAGEMLTVESSDPNVVSVEAMYKHGISLQYLSVGTATVTVTAASGATDTLTVHVTEIPTLTMGELIDIHMDQLDTAYYRFTVETEGTYILVSPNGESYIEVQNVDTYEVPFHSEGWGGDYFFDIFELDPGTYELYMEVHCDYGLDGQLGIGPKTVSQTLDISQTEITLLKDGPWDSLFAVLDSPFAIGQEVTWTTDDENIVTVNSQDVGGVRCDLHPQGIGQTTVTATMGDISVTCTVTVEAMPELTEGEEVSVTSSHAGQAHYFTFTPEITGTYTFMASQQDIMVDLWGYDGSSSSNLTAELTAGEIYTVSFNYLNGQTGTFDVAVKQGNYCGMNATWTVDDGKLIISGTGDMFNYIAHSNEDVCAWSIYRDEITHVVIGDGITSIGNQNFLALYMMKTVTVPASVTKIGEWAFTSCESLETVVFEGDAPAIAESAFTECYFVNVVYPVGNETWTKSVMQDYGGYDIKWSDGAYLYFRYLQNEGSGFFSIEEEMFIFTAMDTTPGDCRAVIFYTNIWDGQTWTATPVEVQGNEFVTLNKIMDVDPENIESGATDPEYYFYLDVTDESWDQSAAVSVTLDSGRTLTLPISVVLPTNGFYSAPEISTENYIRFYEWDPDTTEDRVFYYGYLQNNNWTLTDLWTHDPEGNPLSGSEYVSVEALDNGMYRITVSQDAPDGFWLDMIAVMEHTEGFEDYGWFGIDCHAGQSKKPYLAIYDLNWSEEGWYLEGEWWSTGSFMLTPGSQRMVLFALNYLDENGAWVEKPVEIQWSDGLTVTKIQDLENESIASGAQYSQYYYQIQVNDWFLLETVSYELNGEPVSVTVDSSLPEFAFYSEAEVSTDYFIYDYQWDPDSDDSRDFYFGVYGFLPTESLTVSTVDPEGNALPGTEYVTLTKLDNGMYRITVSAAVEEGFYLELWFEYETAEGGLGGNSSIFCMPAEDNRCGENAYWSFDEATGTLTVTGIGAMDNYYEHTTQPWYHLMDQITAVVVEEGITSLGYSAFQGCTALESAVLPEGLTTIELYAFAMCTNLDAVVIHSSDLTTMKDFLYGTGAYAVFTGDMPATLTSVANRRFFYPADNATWTAEALASCDYCKSVYDYGTGEIYWNIENGQLLLVGIGEVAGNASADSAPWSGRNAQITEACVLSGITKLNNVFTGCENLKRVRFVGNAISFSADAFAGLEADVLYPIANTSWTGSVCQSYGGNVEWAPYMIHSGNVCSYMKGSVLYIYGVTFDTYADMYNWTEYDAVTVTEIVVEGVEKVSSYLYDRDDVTKITVGPGVKSVGFMNLRALADVDLDAAADIEAIQFYGCSSLESITVPATVKTLGEYALGGNAGLKTVTFLGDAPAFHEYAFINTTAYAIYPAGNATWTADVRQNYGGTITWVNGQCGDNAYWSLEDGTLTVMGTGAIYEGFFADNLEIKHVVIEAGITSIGVRAFEFCTNLISVMIPDTVTSIGGGAFMGCESLTTANIPANITAIENVVFTACTNLTDITIPQAVTWIGYNALAGTGITNITIPESVEMIGPGALAVCPNLTEIVFLGDAPSNTTTYPDGSVSAPHTILLDVTATAYYPGNNDTWTEEIMASYGGTITWVPVYPTSGQCGENVYWSLENGMLTITGAGAMYDYNGTDMPWLPFAEQITQVEVGYNITYVGSYAFYHCTNLTTANLFYGVEELGDSAFYGCAALTAIELPDSLLTVGDNAFAYCTAAESIYARFIETIGDSAFFHCDSLVSVELPDSVTAIGNSAFDNCGELTAVTLNEGLISIGESAFSNCPKLTAIDLPDSLTGLGAYAFCNDSGLTTVSIGGSLTVIDEYAFYNCTDLTVIEVPETVTAINAYAFGGCDSLAKITFVGNAPAFGENVFHTVAVTVYYPGGNTTWTEEVLQQYGGNIIWVPVYPTSGQCGENVYWEFTEEIGVLTITGQGTMDEHVGDPSAYPWYAFKDQILEVMVYESVTNVGAYAFDGYPNLQIAVLQVKTIGDHAFDGCTNMNVVSVTGNLTHIGIRAFADTAITAINLSDGLTSIGGEAFMGSKLTSVTIPDTVTEWSDGAFQECLDLKDVTLGEGLTGVPSYLFVGCTALETVEIPSTATYIGECSFKGCSALKNVVIPDGMKELYVDAFYGCVSLTSIEIPASVELMQKPFRGCTGLTEITFLGDAPVIVDDKAFEGVTATIYYPGDNATWTEEVMQQYGGTITWVPVYDLPMLELGVAQDVTYSEDYIAYTYYFSPAADGYYAIYLDADVDAVVDIYTLDYSMYSNKRIAAGSGDYLTVSLTGGEIYEITTWIETGAPIEGSIRIGTSNRYVTGLEITNLPDRLTYVEGFVMEALDLTGLQMTVTWADGTTTGYVHENDYNNIGDYTLIAEQDKETGEIVLICCEGSARFAVELTENTVAGLEITNADELPGLLENAYYTTYGGYSPHVIYRKVLFRVTYTDGTSEIINMLSEVNGYTIKCIRMIEGPNGTNTFTFSLLGTETVYEASFVENPVASIEVVSEPDPLVYGVDDHVMKDAEGVFRYRLDGGFRFPGLEFRINYTDGTSRVVSFADLTWPASAESFYNFPEYENYPVEAQPYLPEYGEGWTYWSGSFAADENGEIAMRLHYMGAFAEFTLIIQESEPETELNGWVQIDGVWYYYVDNVKQTGWVKVGNYWYYMDSNGAMQTGWVKVGANWYYMSAGGAMQTGWVSVGGKWYYMSSGGVMQTGWVYVGNNWYYFASGGAMQTGWLTLGNSKYYLHSSGAMAVGLTEIDGSNYYFASSGVMQIGWQTVEGVKYLFGSDGAAVASGWYKDGENWYYLNTGGSVTTGWQTINGNKYYMDADGIMQTGLQTISGKVYYFAPGGAMQTGWQVVNGVGHLFGSDGAAVTGWYKENNNWYYLDSTGAKQTGWLTIGSNRYYMNADGVMQTGWLQYDGKWYYLASGGAMVTGWAKVGSYWYYMDANGVMTTGWVKVGGSWYYMNKSGVMQTGWVKVGNYWYYMNSSGVMLTGTQTIDGKTYIFNDNGVWIG